MPMPTAEVVARGRMALDRAIGDPEIMARGRAKLALGPLAPLPQTVPAALPWGIALTFSRIFPWIKFYCGPLDLKR